MSRDLERLLHLKDKGVKEARDPLARLYREILKDIEMNTYKMNDYLIRWLDDPRNGIPNNGKMRSTERGNLIQEITRPNMTWKVFMKGLRFLPIKRVRFVLDIEWDNKKITQHSTIVNIHEEGEDGQQQQSEN